MRPLYEVIGMYIMIVSFNHACYLMCVDKERVQWSEHETDRLVMIESLLSKQYQGHKKYKRFVQEMDAGGKSP